MEVIMGLKVGQKVEGHVVKEIVTETRLLPTVCDPKIWFVEWEDGGNGFVTTYGHNYEVMTTSQVEKLRDDYAACLTGIGALLGMSLIYPVGGFKI
jgi:hypothetical protein